jgi:sterol desaturase/sphingolipid hydroxylase (fatty acid hydroxylase superfamily)
MLLELYRCLHTSWPYSERAFFVVIQALILETIFWGLNGLLAICYWKNLFPQWRIRKYAFPDADLMKRCLFDRCFINLFVRPAFLWFAYPVLPWRKVSFSVQELPSSFTIIWQLLLSSQIDDALFYWMHRFLHHKAIYRHIHKRHHEFHDTIGLATEFAHPVEDLLSSVIPTVAGPILLGSHVIVLLLYSGLKLAQSIDAHSGYRFPFPISPWSVLGIMDCSFAHNYHHSHNSGNYGGYTIFWDWLMGTNTDYVRHQELRKKES